MMRICLKGVHFNGPFDCYERIMVIQTFNSRPSSHSHDLQVIKCWTLCEVACVFCLLCKLKKQEEKAGLLLVHTFVIHLCQSVFSECYWLSSMWPFIFLIFFDQMQDFQSCHECPSIFVLSSAVKSTTYLTVMASRRCASCLLVVLGIPSVLPF